MSNKINEIINILDNIYPNCGCELHFSNLYELTIAVILSAQTTDVSVNKVTPVLFKKYPDLNSLADAEYNDVKEIIRSLGLSSTKAKNIILFSKQVTELYHGEIPSTVDELMKLSGIGRKTANVVTSIWFQNDVIAVDTHVERVSKRLGLVDNNLNTYQTELKLMEEVPTGKRGSTHHLLIHFGRDYCKSQKPLCKDCPLKKYCLYNRE